ncbi:MAG TPA: hypothetical protein VF169_04735 [Albitalea sp.]|uniref:hypothetical protein n=1 Tax=Piscinibacter sp. TaxID=1903157 RepID=UPI002ED21EA6
MPETISSLEGSQRIASEAVSSTSNDPHQVHHAHLNLAPIGMRRLGSWVAGSRPSTALIASREWLDGFNRTISLLEYCPRGNNRMSPAERALRLVELTAQLKDGSTPSACMREGFERVLLASVDLDDANRSLVLAGLAGVVDQLQAGVGDSSPIRILLDATAALEPPYRKAVLVALAGQVRVLRGAFTDVMRAAEGMAAADRAEVLAELAKGLAMVPPELLRDVRDELLQRTEQLGDAALEEQVLIQLAEGIRAMAELAAPADLLDTFDTLIERNARQPEEFREEVHAILVSSSQMYLPEEEMTRRWVRLTDVRMEW